MKSLFLIIALTATSIISSQIEVSPIEESYIENTYPEGVYRTYRSFLNKKPNSSKKVEARDLFKPKQRINDPYIDNCYFNYTRTNKRVKDAFAISYNGSLYIHVKSLQALMEGKDKKQKIDNKDSFIRVVDQGRYLYAEGYFRKRGGIGIGVGIGVGPISAGSGGPQEQLKGFVFDFDRQIFELFRDCPDFRDWLDEYHPELPIDCDGKQLPMEFVREIMFEINGM